MKAFMIAAEKSGCGKTTVTVGLLSALKKRNTNIRSFKCGPDYIDPMFHRDVLEIPSENLDIFFAGEGGVRKIFAENMGEISVVEGVMGLYDGNSPLSEEGSSYHVACTLNIPVILIIDAAGMGRSVLAKIRGFLDMDSKNMIKGIILNHISENYYRTIKPVIEAELNIRVLGGIPKLDTVFAGRYLGLKLPKEVENFQQTAAGLGEELTDYIDLDEILKLSDISVKTDTTAKAFVNADRVRIAVARDEAFCFYYEENLRCLKALGAEIVEFSPLHDDALPDNIHGLILGGGYPELYAKELSENVRMRRLIYEAVSRLPSLAECGGFMYLQERLEDNSGTAYEMVGAIPSVSSFKGRLVRFGYVTLLEKGHCFSDKDISIRGHEFHYYDSTANGDSCIAVKRDGREYSCAHTSSLYWWGYAHLYYPSSIEFVNEFIRKCREARDGKLL